jgi:hypothetical protein
MKIAKQMTAEQREALEQEILLAFEEVDRADDKLEAAEAANADPDTLAKYRLTMEKRYSYADGIHQVMRILGISFRIGVDEHGNSNKCTLLF